MIRRGGEVVFEIARDLTVRNGKRTKRYLLFLDAIRLWNCLLDRERLKTLVEIEQRPEFVLKLCFGVKERSRKNFLVSTCLSGSGIVQGELGDWGEQPWIKFIFPHVGGLIWDNMNRWKRWWGNSVVQGKELKLQMLMDRGHRRLSTWRRICSGSECNFIK